LNRNGDFPLPRRYTTMELRNRILTSLSALYLIVIAFTSGSHARTIHAKSEQSMNATLEPSQSAEESISTPEAFTGTILRSGIDFLLRDTSGEVYLVDAKEREDLFEGEHVRIIGIPEADAKILHAEAIEELTA